MPIQILLTIIFSLLMLMAFLRRRIFPPVAAMLIIVCSIALILVWWPSLATNAALSMGVGRGVDLVFYCFIVATLGVSAWLFMTIKSVEMKITILAREITIMNANTSIENKNKTK